MWRVHEEAVVVASVRRAVVVERPVRCGAGASDHTAVRRRLGDVTIRVIRIVRCNTTVDAALARVGTAATCRLCCAVRVAAVIVIGLRLADRRQGELGWM